MASPAVGASRIRRAAEGAMAVIHTAPPNADAAPAAWRHPAWRRLMRSPLFWLGLGLLAFLLAFSFIGPHFYHKDVNTVDVARSLLPPSATFPLGTDVLGENELGRLMIGGQVPIIAGFLCACAAALVGGAVGVVSGFGGRAADASGMRLADAVMSVPQVVAVLVGETVFGIRTPVLITVFALTSWPLTARLIRAETLSLRARPFVEAARASGSGRTALVLRHVLPNLLDPFVATFTAQFTNAILVIALTSYIGAGLGPPWNWATMINANRDALLSGQWWLIVLPGVLFALLVNAVYLIGEAIRAAFNPQTYRRARRRSAA